MIRAVYDAACARDRSPANLARQKEWLARAYPYARRDHDFWLSSIHRAGNTGLARYFDIGEGPVPDIADHSSYYIDVINWLVAHPEVHTNYLIAAPQHPSPAEQAVLPKPVAMRPIPSSAASPGPMAIVLPATSTRATVPCASLVSIFRSGLVPSAVPHTITLPSV